MAKQPNIKINISILVSIVIALISILALTLVSVLWDTESFWRTLITSLLSTSATVSGVEVIWEMVSKKNFADYVINQVRLSQNIQESGVQEVYKDYSYIKWEDEVKNKTHMLVFLAHGSGWLKPIKDIAITNFLNNNGVFTIILADPTNDELMKAYDLRFNYTPGTTKSRIKDTLCILNQLADTAKKRKNIKIRYYNGMSTTSYFFLGKHNRYDKCIYTLYNHSKNSGKAPAFKINKTINGTSANSLLFNCFLDDEMRQIENNSKLETRSISEVLSTFI